jgi:homoserine O-acetyltransferase
MSADEFDPEIERLFARSPQMPDAALFTAEVEQKLQKGSHVRVLALGLAGVIGGVVAVRETMSVNLGSGEGVVAGNALGQGIRSVSFNAQNAVQTGLDQLGLANLELGSMGGMQAMLFAIEYPSFVHRVLPMATTGRESAQAIAFNEVGRQAIMQDPAWNRGDYTKDSGPRVGLAIARMMAHITYVSDASMDRKFGRRKKENAPSDAYTFDVQFEVEGYLRHQGQSFINRFDANSYLYITRALDQFDLAHAYGSLEAAFALVEAETLIVGFTSDWLFPPEQNRSLALALLRAGKRASYAELSTDLGHDSFLLESEELYALVRGFLERDQPYVFDYEI